MDYWFRLLLLFVVAAAAPAEDEAVDLVPRWRKGDVCDRTAAMQVKLRGMVKLDRANRALTVDVKREAEYRDDVLSTTKLGLAERIERRSRRHRTTTVARILGKKTKTEKETDPSEGKTETLGERRSRPFLSQSLDRAMIRKGVRVGDTWTDEDESRVSGFDEAKLTCKLSEVLTYKGHRTAKVYVVFKMRGTVDRVWMEATVRGYVYFSLDAGRIIRTTLKGPVKTKMKEFGTLHGTLRETSTLVVVKQGAGR